MQRTPLGRNEQAKAEPLKCFAGCRKLRRDIKRRTLEDTKMLGTVLLVILILLLIGAFPSWGYSRGWGYGPSGGLGLVLVIVLILLLMGRI